MALILIADDSPTGIESIRTVLEQKGHRIIMAADGAEAVQVATEQQPDLILMDIVMPVMNGFQATRRITRGETTSSIPVIIISAKDQETDRIWGLRQGARDYMAKPLDTPQLLDKIEALLQEG